ncbi:haloacid dehalogenase superfamily enzyme, subfamily IA [Sanguibacter keddieii DSM 10542]|uniref:Haloacid dehalogenase superfamily enzyme, subfamily IA n=1 Tax=Sanguibacter keddieii (strain ATCC 51767 / DSM 10542 / NCFB 3025 / ST-74) TaxID=446469 RepID=D1BDI6_SANKS|nr:haloacid dehalogenase superfamily enzyme, subfamily IA [Sanguibacter keddieii DSM 10542]
MTGDLGVTGVTDGRAPEALPTAQVLFDGRGPLDGVLFDIDDTLVNTRAAFGAAMDGIARVYLSHLPAERLGEVLALWRRDPDGHYRSYTRGEVTLDEQRRRRANQLQEAFGAPPLTEEEFVAWDEVFDASYRAGWAAHDDAVDAVAAVSALGLRVGALSNATTEHQLPKLEATGLGHVPMLVGLDTFGFGKPDPRVFLEACARLGTDPARTLYVGDELDLDARAAVRAGLFGAWLDRPGTRRGGVHQEDPLAASADGVVVLQGLDELTGYLKTV